MSQPTAADILTSILEIRKALETSLIRISELQLSLLSTVPPPGHMQTMDEFFPIKTNSRFKPHIPSGPWKME